MTLGKDSRISQGEIDDTILKESKKIVEFDDLPKGVLKKLLNKINRQSFHEDDPNAEIEIHDDYSFDDVQTSSMSLREKMQICNEVCQKNIFVSFICQNVQLTRVKLKGDIEFF